jgi:hypothetical protein
MTAFDLSFFLLAGITSAGNLQASKGGEREREKETSDRLVIRVSDVPAN